MKCLFCGWLIPDPFFARWSRTRDAKTGLFKCPHCQAKHVRSDAGRLPGGEPLYSFRLWGHPTTRTPKARIPAS